MFSPLLTYLLVALVVGTAWLLEREAKRYRRNRKRRMWRSIEGKLYPQRYYGLRNGPGRLKEHGVPQVWKNTAACSGTGRKRRREAENSYTIVGARGCFPKNNPGRLRLQKGVRMKQKNVTPEIKEHWRTFWERTVTIK